jgi:hypothetical protein
MATNETIEVSYKVNYIDVSPLMKPLHPGKCNYIEATEIAIRGVKENSNILIWDGSTQVIGVDPKGVVLINSGFDHPHYQEHLKIKIELDKAWYENRIKYFQ